MHYDESTIRARLAPETPGEVPRLEVRLSAGDTAWTPEGETVTGPATLDYSWTGHDGDPFSVVVSRPPIRLHTDEKGRWAELSEHHGGWYALTVAEVDEDGDTTQEALVRIPESLFTALRALAPTPPPAPERTVSDLLAGGVSIDEIEPPICDPCRWDNDHDRCPGTAYDMIRGTDVQCLCAAAGHRD